MFFTINREINSQIIGHRRHQHCYFQFFLKFLAEYTALNWKACGYAICSRKKLIEQGGCPMVIVLLYLF